MARSEAALENILTGSPASVARHLWDVTKMGAWLAVHMSKFNGTELDAQELHYDLFL